MTFLGYYDKAVDASLDRVRLELLLVKLNHKKKKESASPVVQVSLGTSEVPVNPSEDNPPSKAPALSIPSKSFSLSGYSGVGRVKTYSLVIRVHTESDENCEPAKKKRKGDEEVDKKDEEEEGRVVSAELVVYD